MRQEQRTHRAVGGCGETSAHRIADSTANSVITCNCELSTESEAFFPAHSPTGQNVETKRISTSSPGDTHQEESLVRASKHVPAYHLVLGKGTRTGLDSDRKAHEQSRSSHRQFVRCAWGECRFVRKRGLLIDNRRGRAKS